MVMGFMCGFRGKVLAPLFHGTTRCYRSPVRLRHQWPKHTRPRTHMRLLCIGNLKLVKKQVVWTSKFVRLLLDRKYIYPTKIIEPRN